MNPIEAYPDEFYLDGGFIRFTGATVLSSVLLTVDATIYAAILSV